jgi:hypothetical protein
MTHRTGWHGATDTGVREKTRTKLQEDILQGGRSEEMSAETGKHQGNKDRRLKEATTSEEREDIWKNFGKTIELEIVKRIARSSVGLRSLHAGLA